ncbi:beta-lactamase family protein [Flavihumibacter rivuli]|uniref:serine hydrolase domain-containing protein n=1 Tax=Flavihumibacter rivuli TaxID=2838156 RepID=UPI001BDDD012|nr:serine hydrolase domain-containing protein [Flavihumibacter rivuli]ULQ57129.1 beta-lactamase family protein [Flavihumibacter rivuli]
MKSNFLIVWILSFTLDYSCFGQSTIKNQIDIKLDSIFSGFKANTPGIAVTVIQKGKVIAKKAYGMASIEFNVPFEHKTLVRMPYSEGREFISIAAALMESDGLLQLNDKVQEYFPQLPQWSSNITIQDLLNHSSGFADEWATLALTQASMTNRIDKSQFLQFLYNQPTPSVEPSKGYMYSNSDFGLLRLILEKASGENLSDYMKRRVFQPLDMKDSRIHNDREDVIPNHAFSYTVGENNTFKLWLKDKTSPGGNYYVLTSANDLEKWASAYTDPKSFISTAIKRLKQNARVIPVLPGKNYVFGHNEKILGTYTATVHMGVSEYPYLARVPEEELTVIMVSNQFQPRWNLMKNVLSACLKIETKPPVMPDVTVEKATINQQQLELLSGLYQWQVPLTFQSFMPRKRFTSIVAGKGVLRVVYSENDTLDLVQLSKNKFRDPEFPDVFIFYQSNSDSAQRLVLYTYDGDTIQMEKTKSAIQKPVSKELHKLTGKYYSAHLDFYLTLVLNERDELVVKRPTIADKILEPWTDGEFRLSTDYGEYSSESWVRFHYDEQGNVTHFTVSHPRLMNHRFDKLR